jgi:uncharacterized coiled-coil DUF342 family protein
MDQFFEQLDLLNNSVKKYKNNKDKLLQSMHNLSIDELDGLKYIVGMLDNINTKINEITDDIEQLQYKIDKNELEKDYELHERIKIYENNQKILDIFLPYMFLYNIADNQKNI